MKKVTAWLLSAAALLISVGASASTEVIVIPSWDYPGLHPYDNATDPDQERVSVLHEDAHNLPTTEFLRGVRMYYEGKCEPGSLQDGEILWTSFSSASGHKVKQVAVAFKYPKGHEKAGQPIPPDDPIRGSTECDLDNGVSVILPAACTNWSVQYNTVPLPQGPPPIVRTTPKCRCYPNNSSEVYAGVSTSSQYFGAGTNCPVYVSGSISPSYIDGSQGRTCVCR